MKPDTLQTRLINWGRWSRSKSSQLVKCQSLEGTYRNRSGQWDWMYPPEDDPPKIDEPDALIVWKAVVKLPWVSQAALRYAYILPWVDRWVAARKCKLYKPDKLEDAVYYAEFMVSNLLAQSNI